MTSPTITRATAVNDGVVHGTTRSVPSVQRTTTTVSSTTTAEPTTQTSTFDPQDYSKISLSLDTKSNDNNEIKVMRPDKNGEEVTVQVLRDVDTSEIAEAIEKKTGHEVRVTVPGHMQRGGAPDPYDRVFASRLGAEAGKLILKGEYGFMVGYKDREIVKVPLSEIAGKLKYVSPDASIIREAKMLGVCFGD